MEAQCRNFENPDQLRAIQDLMAPLMFIIPAWVREVNVYSVYDMPAVLSCRLDIQYRYASFDVSAKFFDLDHPSQRRRLLHEFVHTLLGELAPWVERRLIDPLKEKNVDLHTVLEQEFTERLERVVQEFVYLLEPLIPCLRYENAEEEKP